MNDSLGKYGPCFNAGINAIQIRKSLKIYNNMGVLGVKPPFSLS